MLILAVACNHAVSAGCRKINLADIASGTARSGRVYSVQLQCGSAPAKYRQAGIGLASRRSEVSADMPAPNYGLLVRYTMRAFTQVLQGVAAEYDLTPTQFRVLRTLGDTAAITQVQLAHHAAMDRPYAASIVKQLHARGLIKRVRNAEDKRRIDLILTDRGKALLNAIARKLDRANRRAVAGIKPSDIAIFEQVIARIRANLERHSGAENA
jgi:MarR family transcriptional regulator, organic hydroperoxide resistance regulator